MTTAVAEAPARDRSRLELLRRTLDTRREELEEARRNVARLVEVEKDEIAKSVRQSPTVRAFKLGSPAQRARARREKVEASIPNLEVEIRELEQVLAEEEASHFVAQIREATTAANRLRKAELEGWRKAGEVLVQLNEVWSEVVENAEALDQLYHAITHSPAFKASCVDTEVLAKFSQASRPPVAPFPHDLAGFAKRLLDVAQGVFERNDRRTDHDGRLAEIVPRFTPRVPRLRADRIDRG